MLRSIGFAVGALAPAILARKNVHAQEDPKTDLPVNDDETESIERLLTNHPPETPQAIRRQWTAKAQEVSKRYPQRHTV